MKACTLFSSDNEVAEEWLVKFKSREPLDIYGQKYLIDEISTDYEHGFSGVTIKMYPVYQAKSPKTTKKQEAWGGVCIPPIDSECKVVEGPALWEHSGMSDWIGRNVKVKSTFTNNIGQKIASVESDNAECACFIVECLRPIKTAEQLAEEEREKEAIELYLTMQPASNSKAWDNIGDYARDRYRLAISSGYRKQ